MGIRAQQSGPGHQQQHQSGTVEREIAYIDSKSLHLMLLCDAAMHYSSASTLDNASDNTGMWQKQPTTCHCMLQQHAGTGHRAYPRLFGSF